MAVIQTLKIVALLFVFFIQFKRNDTDLSESRLLWQSGSRRFVLKEDPGWTISWLSVVDRVVASAEEIVEGRLNGPAVSSILLLGCTDLYEVRASSGSYHAATEMIAWNKSNYQSRVRFVEIRELVLFPLIHQVNKWQF